MKRLLLPLQAALALPNAINVSYVAPIYVFAWDKKKTDYSDQKAALNACFDFTEKVLSPRLRDLR